MNLSLRRPREPLVVAGLLLVLLVNLELLTTHSAVKWDAFDEMWPYFRWLGSALRQGWFPDFFPNIMAGYPIGANIQSGTYNAFYLLVAYAFPASVLSINLVYLLTQLAIFRLAQAIARSYALDALASLYFGLAIVASGFVVGHASHFSYLATACGLLAVFLGLRLALAGRTRAACALAFVGVYHVLTAGYPAVILFGSECLALYAAYLLVRAPQSRRSVLLSLAAGVAGALVAAPALWHFAHALQHSPRGEGLDVATAMSGSLPRYALANYLWPVWKMGFTERTMERFHLLLASAPLTLYALWIALRTGRERRRMVVLLALAMLVTVLALGKNSPVPLRVWLAEHVFLFRAGRFPSGEHRGIALFLLALLSAFGLQWLQERWPRRQRLLLAVVVLDFLVVMLVLRGMRISGIDPRYQGTVAQFQASFGPGQQALVDRPRNCRPDGASWVDTAIRVQRDELPPAGFYWNGYVGLRDGLYDAQRDEAAGWICGASRLRTLADHQPRAYRLAIYSPGKIRFTVGAGAPGPAQLLWADHDDGFWRLKINGQPAGFAAGPAGLRVFTAKSGDDVEMTYAGPLSRLWR